MPKSYSIHPILNITHLKKYQPSPAKFGNQPTKLLNRADFDKLLEYKVNKIIAECQKKGKNGQQIIQYLTQFQGYTEDSDEWLNQKQLRNAPEILEAWRTSRKGVMPHFQ